MNILITGGTGFLGSALIGKLLKQNHRITVLSRSQDKVEKIFGDTVKPLTNLKNLSPEDSFDAIVNLAGAPIFASRWSEKRKQILRNSRIDLTRQLIKVIADMEPKPRVLISGSAIGYYGDQGDTVLTEHSEVKSDFSQRLCADWEDAAKQAEQYGVRVCLIRTGLVLGPDGGLLQRMLLPFKLGLGGRIGDGKQWMSWIHRKDWVAIVETMIDRTDMNGPYNATAPNPVSNRQFTDALAKALKRPALIPVPAWALKLGLGEMSELVLGSQRVIPERLLQQGYEFQFADLADALNAILD
ncbi:TIGR01777 family oxidoreductase [Methylomarinum sp. Ch1-1]|uniref:TIGR01777 family oxidoreductase n=1 Tax=Methylomarinum roseum TaxID=3067653 RepID=A0AAU7NTP0_9GAMM|nr:TIGR01777 family oxidoreductase [Methylomarinum sp. Ch1-1]MDP4519588.1 TIGR01777 family oxidoreductase [Methylomarinum sp. Ch1-1]